MRLRFTLLFSALSVIATSPAWAQCNTTNATTCECLDGVSSTCDLLPDLTVSWYATANYLGGPKEFPQTGAGADNGRLRISSSTPNIGHGPLTVGSVSVWVCGVDTLTTYPGVCPDGSEPKQLIHQRVYHKDGITMSNYLRWAGSMTYHPTHGHMHVDDWIEFTLRTMTADPDPLTWPIVATGAKIGFCLMDYGSCSTYNGHCRDSLDNILVNTDFPNYGLGGGSYGCSPVEQGISSGWTDIYSEYLDGMWINLPPGLCNGDYYIVCHVDPNNNFLEEDETNNVMYTPFTLTKQTPSGAGSVNVSASGPLSLCNGETITLTADSASSYAWSTGATTQSINVSAAGTYSVSITTACGSGTSAPVVVTVAPALSAPTTTNDDACEGTAATLTASASAGDIVWYDAASGGSVVGTGPSITIPALTATTSYYAEAQDTGLGSNHFIGPVDASIGTGAYHYDASRYLIFTAYQPFTLKSVWVKATGGGNRTIELRSASGVVLESVTVNVPDGESRITLDIPVPVGTDLRLGVGSTPSLWRNDAGVNYPYTVADVASITNSSASSSYYYFFYDWEVETLPKVCSSGRAVATATLAPAPTVSFSGLAATYVVTDPAATLVGTPAGGTFSGPGVTGSTFSPSAAGLGTHTITYSFTDGSTGCSSTSTQTVTVGAVGVIDPATGAGAPVVYPNPTQGKFGLGFELKSAYDVKVDILSINGQRISTLFAGQVSGKFDKAFDVRNLAAGVYLLEVKVGDHVWTEKLIKE
jgi:hypothetical protein